MSVADDGSLHTDSRRSDEYQKGVIKSYAATYVNSYRGGRRAQSGQTSYCSDCRTDYITCFDYQM